MPSGLEIKAGTTLLSTKQAQLIAKRYYFGSARFKETCNKVLTLLEKAGRSTLKSSDDNKFVQAPVASKIEVEEYLVRFRPFWKRQGDLL
jgi:hypothetical protein